MDLTETWASVEHDGWVVVFVGRRVGRPERRRWLAQAIAYGPPMRRAQAWGDTATAALAALAEATHK